jgi:hypothetical protein
MASATSRLELAHPGAKHFGLPARFLPTFLYFLREPLVHFLLIGLALFLVYSWMHRGRSGLEPSRQILLTLDDLRQMDLYFQSQWHRHPTPEEFNPMLENKVQEEILHREGLAMGLDSDDTIVKRRMAQKMQFLAADVASTHEPSTEELQAWCAKKGDKFALSSRIAFHDIFFGFDKRGQNAQTNVSALAKLNGKPEDSPLAESLADSFIFQDYYADRAPEQLAKEFGPSFAVAIEKLKPGSWPGPRESGYGWHLIFIDSIIPGRIPRLEEVEPDVKTTWLAYQKEKACHEAYAKMRSKYSVLLPELPDQQSPPPPVPMVKKDTPSPSREALPQ